MWSHLLLQGDGAEEALEALQLLRQRARHGPPADVVRGKRVQRGGRARKALHHVRGHLHEVHGAPGACCGTHAIYYLG